MVPGAAAAAVVPATPIGIAIAQPAMATSAQVVYNPAPPVKPTAKKAAGCLGVLVGIGGLSALAGLLAAAALH
jgi:hypothetical protein